MRPIMLKFRLPSAIALAAGVSVLTLTALPAATAQETDSEATGQQLGASPGGGDATTGGALNSGGNAGTAGETTTTEAASEPQATSNGSEANGADGSDSSASSTAAANARRSTGA